MMHNETSQLPKTSLFLHVLNMKYIDNFVGFQSPMTTTSPECHTSHTRPFLSKSRSHTRISALSQWGGRAWPRVAVMRAGFASQAIPRSSRSFAY